MMRIAVVAGLALVLATNWAANALPIAGRTTGEVADRFRLSIDPASYAFSIWGVIYLGLLAYAVYQALPSPHRNPRLRAIATPFIVSCLANASWILLWHHELFALTVLAIGTLLGSLLVIYLRLEVGRTRVDWPESLFVRAPFGLYLGWVTVATILNTAIALASTGWDGAPLGADSWGLILIGVATTIAVYIGYTRRDLAYAAAVAWALVAILVRQDDAAGIATAAGIAAAVALAAPLAGLLRRRLAPAT